MKIKKIIKFYDRFYNKFSQKKKNNREEEKYHKNNNLILKKKILKIHDSNELIL